MREQTTETPKYKITFIGDENTGKSSLIRRFTDDSFNIRYEATIGIDFLSKTMYLEDRSLRLQIWDCAGQGRFNGLTPSYIKDSAVVFIVFDVTQRQSYNSLSKWINMARTRNERPEGSPIILVANKTDLTEKRVISTEEITDFARRQNLSFVETSAKNSSNVAALFRQCTDLLPLPAATTQKEPPLTRLPTRASTQVSYQDLTAKIQKLTDDNPNNQQIKAIANILNTGLSKPDPQKYFDRLFQTDAEGTLKDEISLKYQIRQLAWTNPSLCNSVVNYLLTIVGLPLAYCFGVLEQNKKTHGHSCMFFASGEKQQAISTCNQVFDTVKASCRV